MNTKQVFKELVTIYVMTLLFLLVVLIMPAHAEGLSQEARDFHAKRGSVYAQQVAGEIQRKHELEIEKAKIEVLGKLQQLDSSTINVSAFASNRNKIKNTVSQTN